MGTESRLDIAANWDEEERRKLFIGGERLLIYSDPETGFLPSRLILSEPDFVLAAISLVQEGHLKLDSDNPGFVCLTESGGKLAAGIRALSHG